MGRWEIRKQRLAKFVWSAARNGGLKVCPVFANPRVVVNFLLRAALCLLVLLTMTLFWVAVFDAEADGLGASFSRNLAALRAAVLGGADGQSSRL